MSELDRVVEAFRRRDLVDWGRLLKPGGRRELEREIGRLKRAGRRARVLLLSRGDKLTPWRVIWERLQLEQPRDLLLLFNGERWEARGWGLERETISAILDRSEAELRVYYAKGLAAALRRLGEAAGVPASGGGGGKAAEERADAGESSRGSSFPLWIPASACAVAGVAGVGAAVAFIIKRRERRKQEIQQTYQKAVEEARGAYTEAILRADELSAEHAEQAEEIQARAGELGEQLDALEREVAENPNLRGKSVTLGRIQHIRDELMVLTSTVLQKARS